MFMKNKKQKMLVLSLAVVLLVGVGTTIAYLISTPDAVKNVFIPSSVSCAVDEDFANNQVKSNVRVKNTGDIDAYIRAEVVVTWKNENGEIYDVLCGPFFVCGLGEEDFDSLTETQMEIYSKRFAHPELFLTIGGNLMVVPV